MERIKNNKTLRVMLLGIIIWGIAFQIGILFFADKGVNSIGLWIGIAVALFMGYNMAATLEDAMDFGEAGAVSHMRKFLLIRYAVACASIFILGITGFGNVVTCFIGILGLKISAYLEPTLSRIIYGKEEPVYSDANEDANIDADANDTVKDTVKDTDTEASN